jgi:hypothetical protein
MRRLLKAVSEKRLWLTVLGKTGRQYIWLLRTGLDFDPAKPNLLIAGGFHGEEIAGPLAILKWIETAGTCPLNKTNITFLPVVNPIGFNRGSRYARTGQKTNCGFCHTEENGDKLSVEGQLLMENIDFLLMAARDGFLSLHEDVTTDKFYIYSYEASKKPGFFPRAVRDEEAKHFEAIPDGEKINEEGDPDAYAIGGLVQNFHDGSFEDYLLHKGVRRCLTTETPGLQISLEKRIEVGVVLINKFLNLSKQYFNLK